MSKEKCPKCNRFIAVKDGKFPMHRTKKGHCNKKTETRSPYCK